MAREIVEHEHPVALGDLDRCLRRYWDDCGKDDERPVHRALTMNLVAIAPADDESLLRATVQELLRTNPCIAMLVLLVRDDRPLEATFATHVEMRRSSRAVLLEQITFRVSKAEEPKVPSVIRPLLVDDIPTKALLASALPDDLRLVRELGRLADLLVYDSSLFADPDRDVTRIDDLAVPTADLAWARLQPWRHALAEALEHVEWPPMTKPRATIRHGGGAGSRAACARLARWLGERLGADVRILENLDVCTPSFEPCSVLVEFDDVQVHVRHAWPAAMLDTSVTLADRCIVPFKTVSRSSTRAELLAEAAQKLEVVLAPPEPL